MKKKIMLIISIVSFLLITGIVIYLFSKDNNVIDEKVLKDEYYIKMHNKMLSYYKIKSKRMKTIENNKGKTIGITLGLLEKDGFPMDEFVSYESKKKCDLNLSYATVKFDNGKYEINVYYKCGEDANYDYKEYQKQLAERE